VPAASRRPGLSMNAAPHSPCVTPTGRRSPMSISRRSPAGDQPPSCSRKMMRGGLRRISPSCRGCQAGQRTNKKAASWLRAGQTKKPQPKLGPVLGKKPALAERAEPNDQRAVKFQFSFATKLRESDAKNLKSSRPH
jgi:hypothetical protein